ncbi:MAG: hypothetical protein ABJB98_03765 [Actinomycetota bacterium]
MRLFGQHGRDLRLFGQHGRDLRLFGQHGRDLRLWRAELAAAAEISRSDAKLPPFERVAADLRRVRRLMNALPQGTSWVRVEGLNRAYDDLLRIACTQLDLQTTIRTVPEGDPRHLERARIELLLTESGLLL